MANKKKDKQKKAGDGQVLGPVTHIKASASDMKAFQNTSPGILARQTQPSKNTVALSPMNHLRKETKTTTQMYSGKGTSKSKDATKVRAQKSTQTSSKGTKNTKSSKSTNTSTKKNTVPKALTRDQRMMNASLGGKSGNQAPSYMLSDKGKKKREEQDAAQGNSPMGMLRRHAQRVQTGRQDNYIRKEADAKLPSSQLSGMRKLEQQAKKTFQENRNSGGQKTFLSKADQKNLSEEEQNAMQLWKDQWDEGQRLIDQGQTKKGKQMQEEAHRQAEHLRMTQGYSGGEGGTDFVTPDMKGDEYAVMSDQGRKDIRVAKSLYEYGKKTGDKTMMQQAAQMGRETRLTPASYDLERSEAYLRTVHDKPVTNPNRDAYGRTIYTPNEWEEEQGKKWGTAVGKGIAGGFLTLLDTARKATNNAIQNRYDPAYQSRQFTARELQRKAEGRLSEREKQILSAEAAKANRDQIDAAKNADDLVERVKLGAEAGKSINDYIKANTPDDREKIRLAAEAGKMRTAAKEVKHDEGIPSYSTGMQMLRESNEASQNLVSAAKTPAGRFLTKTGLSMAQMAPFLLANVIPGAGQAISLGGMSALAAGQKAGELQADPKVSAQEALGRGLISGGIEAFTEKISLDRLLNLIRKGGGTNFIIAAAKQAGVEASEESASYALNYLADKAAKDPKAKFSMEELLESAGIGAVSGAAFGAGGHFIGDALAGGRRTTRPTPTPDETTPSPTPDTESIPTPTQEESTPRPIQEADTAPSDNPLIRATRAQEEMRTQAQEQAQANRDTRNQLLTARQRLAQAQAEYRQRMQEASERETAANREESLVQREQELRSHLQDSTERISNAKTESEFLDAVNEQDQVIQELRDVQREREQFSEDFSTQQEQRIQEQPPLDDTTWQQEQQPQAQPRNYNEIPDTFDEYKAQFQDDIDSREMTEGQLLDEYNALKRRNARIQNKQAAQPAQEEATPYNSPGLRDSVGAAREEFDPYSRALNRYGAIEPGENPARLVDVPQSMTGSDRVRKFARTAMEAGVTSDKTVELLQKAVVDGDFSYTPKKMNDLASRAIDALSTPRNAAKSMALWEEVVNGDRTVTDDDIALGIMMMKAAEQAGDSRTASQLAGEIAALGTELGRGVNALRLLKKATPEGKLFYIRKSVDKLNQNIRKRNKGKNRTAAKGKNPSDLSDLSYQDITVPDELSQQLLNAKTQEEQDAAIDAIYDYVADRVPKDVAMRVDAWRYFAMLGNPRTHIRNVAGNILMQGVTRSSNATSALLQNIFIRDANKRTRTGAGTMEAHRFAKEDFKKNKDLLSGNPYTTSEGGQIMQRVREKAFTVDANKREKNAFWRAMDTAMKPLHKASNFNSKALDLEDMLFKRSTYIDSMANFLTARGYGKNLNNVPEKVLQEARTHAVDDALEATFQQYSELASKLAQMEASNKAGQFIIGGTFPFKRVPINIAKTAAKFSPAGLVKTLTSDAVKLRNGDITAADFCDNVGAGLNGSGLAVLGAFLFAKGILSVGGDDDDKQAGFDAAMGGQNYAINIGDYSYTIDWAAPAVVPLFMGAEFWNAVTTKDEEASLSKAALDAVGRMFEPMLQMTTLSGVSSTIKSASYSQQDPIYAILANVATNYAGQFVPTALGQVARTIDPIRRTTFTDANSKVPKEIQQFLQRQGAKIPGLSQKMPEYLDVWGRNDVGSDNVLLRALENFVSPGYVAKKSGGSVEQELQRLNDAGYEGMLPGAVQKSAKLDGNRMTADQWMKRQKEQGSVAHDILQDFIGTAEYNKLTDEQKAKFVDKAYDYAKNSGQAAAGGDTSDMAKWYEAANNAPSEGDLSKAEFLALYAYKSAIEDEAPDEAKASVKQGMWEEYIKSRTDLSQKQRDYVLDKVKFWQMKPADSGAYQKAKNAGYETPEEIQKLLEAKSTFSTDGNTDINNSEMYKGITSQTSDPAEQEKMYNAIKDKDATKSWKELAAEQSKQQQAESAAQSALDKSLSKDMQTKFATAMESAGTKQTDAYRALVGTGASEAECKAYYAYLSAQRGWKKTWEQVKKKAAKGE